MFSSTSLLASAGSIPSFSVATAPPVKKRTAVQPIKRKRESITEVVTEEPDRVKGVHDTLLKIQNKLEDVSLQHKELLRYLKVHRTAMISAVELATYKIVKDPGDKHSHVKTLSDLITAKLPVTDIYADLCAINALAAPLNEYVKIEAAGKPLYHLRLFLKNERAKQHTFLFVSGTSVSFSVFCDKLDEFVGKKVKRPKTKKDTQGFLSVFGENRIEAVIDSGRIDKLKGLYVK